MNKDIYCNLKEKVKMVYPIKILSDRKSYIAKNFLGVFFEDRKKATCTLMKFPKKATNTKEEQIQKQNYNYFIHTMAEMIKKYIPDMED